MLIGDKNKVGFEVGKKLHNSVNLVYLDIWVCGKHINAHDNVAHLPTLAAACEDDADFLFDLERFQTYFKGLTVEGIRQFILSTRDENSENYDLEDDDIFPNHRILDWGPNTDTVFCFIVKVGGQLYLTMCFDREENKVFSCPLTKNYFTETLKALFCELRKKI